jgi:8-oxo-dGTP pyrophosphatase MutT (NUDIX family)
LTFSRRLARLLFPDPPSAAPLPTLSLDGEEFSVNGAQVALLDARDRVLLQFRPWPPGWELPGGHCEPGEEPAETAAREAGEETGLKARILGLSGVYVWDGLRQTGDAVFLGEVAGGARRRSLEAWSVRRFSADRLPRTIFPWERQRVLDAVARRRGGPPVHRVQSITVRHVLIFGLQWLHIPIDAVTARRRARGAR